MDSLLRFTTLGALFLFQGIDYGGYAAPALTVVLAAFTVYSQIRQKRIEASLTTSHQNHKSTMEVLDAWKQMVNNQTHEIRDMRGRLRAAEAHTRICEKGQLKLVAQLIKAGVDIDLDRVLDDLSKIEHEIVTAENAREAADDNDPHRTIETNHNEKE